MELVGYLLLAIISIALGYFVGAHFTKKSLSEQTLSNKTNSVSLDRFEDAQNIISRQENDLNAKMDQITNLSTELAEWKQKYLHQEEKLAAQKDELKELQENFKNEFKVLAQNILEKNSTTFKTQNKEQIDTLLNPFKDKLESFEKKVQETYENNQKETVSLKTEVKSLMQLNEKLSKEAGNLTKALKGDVKMQGNWGEVILERILEKSGLTKNSEYFVQNSMTNEDGKRFQPDVLIKLPDEKHVIVDSKVSLVAYEKFAAAENIDEQQEHLKMHVQSIKNHIKGLSNKNYQNLYGIDGLDFVLLFIPIEGAFSAAMQADNALFQEAFDKNVVVVSTSTLLATLRTIASIWKQEKQTQNALEIARQGGDLYDKFVGFTEDLIALGKQMNTATKSYQGAMNKLSEGRGNLINRAERLKNLGLKATKAMDQKLIDRSENEE